MGAGPTTRPLTCGTRRSGFPVTKKYITLDHGSGGEASRRLVEEVFLTRLDNPLLRRLDDSAVLPPPGQRLAFTTDSYVIDPPFFPGGNIGSLAVHGTVNDLAMQGALPMYLSLALILEEGLPLADLKRIVDSAAEAAREARVAVVAGDTKVVPKGAADRIFINTSGIGLIPDAVTVAADNAQAGDRVLVNGNIGDHGIAILTRREGLRLRTELSSDSAPLNTLVAGILQAGCRVHTMRDPTRGAGHRTQRDRPPIEDRHPAFRGRSAPGPGRALGSRTPGPRSALRGQ